MPPNANPQTLQFVATYCAQHLAAYGFSALYLIGSRAYGIPRQTSDHDFIAIVSDSAPQGIITGGVLHSQIFQDLNSSRMQAGLTAIDLLIARNSYFDNQSSQTGTFAHAAVTKGYKVV